jgi:hypothetical protein
MSGQKETAGGRSRIALVIVAIAGPACLLYMGFLVLGPFAPLAFDRTISVSNVPLDQIPKRFHPHFSPNATGISGEYSSKTRQCKFSYSCDREDFEALIERELLPAKTIEDGALTTGRQWGPGVASYEFYPDSGTATVAASAF